MKKKIYDFFGVSEEKHHELFNFVAECYDKNSNFDTIKKILEHKKHNEQKLMLYYLGALVGREYNFRSELGILPDPPNTTEFPSNN